MERDVRATQGISRRQVLAAATVAGGAALALGVARSHQATHPAATTSSAPRVAYLYLTILPGGGRVHKDWPEYVPADFVVPAHALVQVEIRCFDTGAASVPSGYERVKGTVDGTIEVTPQVDGDLSTARWTRLTTLPSNGVAHTLTFADLGLNVPIPPLSTVRFAFRTGPAGRYGWQCMAACGTGEGGWGGPMATQGWMEGTMTVQA
jgi:hypothetical protein